MNKDKQTTETEKTTEVAGLNECLVIRWRCGWCGAPTRQDGQPLAMSEIGLTNNIEKYWADAEQVHGDCCINDILNNEHYDHERRIDELGA